jgi:hypothetical protein
MRHPAELALALLWARRPAWMEHLIRGYLVTDHTLYYRNRLEPDVTYGQDDDAIYVLTT